MLRRAFLLLVFLSLGSLWGCNPVDRLVSARLLHAEPNLPFSPLGMGMDGEDVRFRDGEGRLLQGWFIPCGSPKGAVFLCKGSDGTVSSFLEVARFLHEAGLQVFLFDYAGCGLSEGHRSLATLPDQVRAAWNCFLECPGLRRDRLGVYGISLGAPLALRIMAEHPEVKTGVFESLFDPPRTLSKVCGPITAWMAKRWILSGPSLISEWSEAVGDRPVLFVVPTLDFLDFPLEAARPGRDLWSPPAVHHPLTLCCPGYRQRVLARFLTAFEGEASTVRVLSWNATRSDGVPVVLPPVLRGISRIYHVLPAERRILTLPAPESRDPRGIPLEGAAALALPDTLPTGPSFRIDAEVESPRRAAVELTALSESGQVIGRGRGWCGPGRSSLACVAVGKPALVCASVRPGPEPVLGSPPEGSWTEPGENSAEAAPFLEMDLAGPSPAADRESAWILDRLFEEGRSQEAVWILVSRWSALQGAKGAGPTFERACLSLAAWEPRLAPRVRGWLADAYPDFGRRPLRDFLPWMEANREALHPVPPYFQISGSFRLETFRPGALLAVSADDRGVWQDVEIWMDGARIDGRSAVLPSGPRQVRVKQGRLEMLQEIPAEPAAIVVLDLDRMAKRDGPWLGVEFDPLRDGWVNPVKGGPAERAGMKPGDVVTAVDGKGIGPGDVTLLRRAILSRAPGDVLALELTRGVEGKTERLSLSVTLEKRPPSVP